MIRLLLAALGVWAAWQYRDRLKQFADHQFPDAYTKVANVKSGLQAATETALKSARMP